MVQRGRVERQHVRRQREMPNGGAGDLDLRILQLCIGNLRGSPMKNLAVNAAGGRHFGAFEK